MKTYLCPECGRELEKGKTCPECGKEAIGLNLLSDEIARQVRLAKLKEEHGPRWRLFKSTTP